MYCRAGFDNYLHPYLPFSFGNAARGGKGDSQSFFVLSVGAFTVVLGRERRGGTRKGQTGRNSFNFSAGERAVGVAALRDLRICPYKVSWTETPQKIIDIQGPKARHP